MLLTGLLELLKDNSESSLETLVDTVDVVYSKCASPLIKYESRTCFNCLNEKTCNLDEDDFIRLPLLLVEFVFRASTKISYFARNRHYDTL
jgi:hypothetical protein